MITIVDYGLGNIQAFANVYKRLGIPVAIAKDASDLTTATKLILPGVGAFDHAMKLLTQSGMRYVLEEMVISEGVPVLGVCVGMQILAAASEEGHMPGLGWIPGKVLAFRSNEQSAGMPLPHMGWNDIRPHTSSVLFEGFAGDERFYFLHSFYFQCDHDEYISAETTYGTRFSCAVQRKNIFGVQFHPEKSHKFGTQLLKNFADF
jgi:glutamine amidotransferase